MNNDIIIIRRIKIHLYTTHRIIVLVLFIQYVRT